MYMLMYGVQVQVQVQVQRDSWPRPQGRIPADKRTGHIAGLACGSPTEDTSKGQCPIWGKPEPKTWHPC